MARFTMNHPYAATVLSALIFLAINVLILEVFRR